MDCHPESQDVWSMVDTETRCAQFVRAVEESPLLGPVLVRWDEVDLPDAWLVAGAVDQTYWNIVFDLPPEHGIRDIDIVYFDDTDLSAEREAEAERRIRALFDKVPGKFDVKNEARVHLWYEERFGDPIEPYRSAEEAIATFPTTSGAIAVRPGSDGLEILAPFGLSDLFNLIVRPNKAQITRQIYEAKVKRWRTLWPNLDFRPW